MNTVIPCILVSALALAAINISAAEFHVAPNGDDSGSGTTDKPFATLERARDAIRELKKAGPLKEPVTVWLRGGVYTVVRTLQLTEEDSGTAAAPVVYRNQPGEKVRLLGGKAVTGWTPVTDPAVRMRLAPEARDHVLQADLKKLGVSDLGVVAKVPGGQGRGRTELFCNGKYLTLARYPNDGEWMRIAEVPQQGEKAVTQKNVSHYGRFTYEGDRPSRWKDLRDVWVHGYWVYDWSDQYHRIQKLDVENKELWPQPPYHGYGYKKRQRFYCLNIVEELDQPGEWYLDRHSGRLYLWLPCEAAKAEVVFPELQETMIQMENAQHVEVRGLICEGSRAGAVVIKGGSHNVIAGCVLRNLGGAAVVIKGGTTNGVRGCDIYEVATTGVSVDGGDRKSLVPAGNYVEDCDIHHFARIQKTYAPAVQINGVGNRISHCFIHDAPHMGIGYGGNDHVIEYCEFTRIAQETGDVGTLYAAMDWTYLGHTVRYNYFHDIHGPGNLGCFTIYPDLPCGGIHLFGNVFRDVDQVFHTNSGRGMVIENNIFVKCRGLSFQVWHDPKKFDVGGDWQMVERLQEVRFDQPPYSTRYPMLQRLAEDFRNSGDQLIERRLPKDNLIRRNVSWGSTFLLLRGPVSPEHVKVEANLIADDVVLIGSLDGTSKAKTYRNGDPAVMEAFAKHGNVIVQGDPGFVDAASGNLELKPESAAWKLGFQRIPFEQIGLRRESSDRPSDSALRSAAHEGSNMFFGWFSSK